MTPRTIPSSPLLGAMLRQRREELAMTLEDAARAAGVGSETLRRYEGGAGIRQDKVRGLLKALRWKELPSMGESDRAAGGPGLRDYETETSDAYSKSLAESVSGDCARLFALGCDLLRDELNEDIRELTSRPRGTHVGESFGSLSVWLPEKWMTRYDREFLCRLRAVVEDVRLRAVHPGYDGIGALTRCVADDLVLHLIFQQAQGALGTTGESETFDERDVQEWEYELNGEDDEVIHVLYSDSHWPNNSDAWHFDQWFDWTYYGLNKTRSQLESAEGQ